MSIDSIGNFLTVMRNGLMRYHRSVIVPFSKEKVGIATILKEEGFIKDFQKIETELHKPQLKIFLKYVNGEAAIHSITRISTPGRRCYEGAKNLTSVINGLGISILTTNAGIISDRQARKVAIGGEVICHVW